MIIGRHKISSLKIPRAYEVSISLLLIILSIGFYRLNVMYTLYSTGVIFRYIAQTLAIIATILTGKNIILGAIKGLIKKKFNVDELISMAIIASIVTGEYLVAAEVAFIMTIGAFLEDRVSDRSRKAIEELYKLAPRRARLRLKNEDKMIPVEEVKPGDLILVKPWEEIPVDGMVTTGFSSVNEASLTGESKPSDKSPGEMVLAGTQNLDGALEIKTLKVGSSSALGRMIELTREALREKTPLTRLVDKFASWFTPAVFLFTLLVYFLTRDIMRAVAVLVVACPCSLVLATPTALTAALGKAARMGVLVKGGAYLEKAAEVDAIIFDKTGTLTIGEPQVKNVLTLNSVSKEELLFMASIAEIFSEHHLGKAIVKESLHAGKPIPNPEEVKVVPGKGIVAKYNGTSITVGKASFLKDGEFKSIEEALHLANKEEKDGRTTFFVAWDNEVKGIISMEDVLREDTLISMAVLKKMSHKIVLLSGDNHNSTATMASKAGISEFRANLLPEDKVVILRELKREGRVVAAVGDGINDAPLLARADVGIAMGNSGFHITLEAASVVLLRDDIEKIPAFLKLARRTRGIIRQNLLIFGVMYNLLAFTGASLGYLTPFWGAVIHNLGAVMVILNSSRLLR